MGFKFTQRVQKEYRKYLVICLKYPNHSAVPSTYIDDFWHLHILDTIKYKFDCDEYLGFFLHHFPYFGMRGEKDEENLSRAWTKTLELYEQEFGSTPKDLWPKSQRCPNCGRRCKSTELKESYFNEMRPKLSDLEL